MQILSSRQVLSKRTGQSGYLFKKHYRVRSVEGLNHPCHPNDVPWGGQLLEHVGVWDLPPKSLPAGCCGTRCVGVLVSAPQVPWAWLEAMVLHSTISWQVFWIEFWIPKGKHSALHKIMSGGWGGAEQTEMQVHTNEILPDCVRHS